jgi:hypothetical protein
MCRVRIIVETGSEECAESMMTDVQSMTFQGKTPYSVRRYGKEIRAVFDDLPDELEEDTAHLNELASSELADLHSRCTRLVAQPVAP